MDIKKARDQALEKHNQAKQLLWRQGTEDISKIAQEVNDTWLHFKKLDIELSNSQVMKKLTELYGC